MFIFFWKVRTFLNCRLGQFNQLCFFTYFSLKGKHISEATRLGRLTEKERDQERIMEKYREVDLVNFDYSAKISYIWNIFNTMEINSYLDDPNRTVFIIFLKII